MVLTKINHVNELKDQGYTILMNVLDPETDIQPLINENVHRNADTLSVRDHFLSKSSGEPNRSGMPFGR